MSQHKQIIEIIDKECKNLNAIKVQIGILATFRKNYEGRYIYAYNVPMVTSIKEVLEATNIRNVVNSAIAHIEEQVDEFMGEGSGWIFDAVEQIFIAITQFTPPLGNSSFPLPNEIIAKKGIVNVKNEDNRCFMWAI